MGGKSSSVLLSGVVVHFLVSSCERNEMRERQKGKERRKEGEKERDRRDTLSLIEGPTE